MSEKSDPRVIRTRKLIEDAFVELWTTKPLQHITVKDITQKATINRATFYAHFQDKYELCDACVQNTFKATLIEHLAPDAVLSKATFRQLTYATIQFVVNLRQHCTVPAQDFDPYIETGVQSIVFDRLMTWIQPDYLSNGCEAGAEVTATALSWAIFGIALRLSEQKHTALSVDAVTDELVNVLAMGLWQSLAQFQPSILSNE